MKKPMRKVRKFNGETGSYTGDDPIVKYRMGKMSADEANIALGRPDMVKGSLSQEEEKSPVVSRSMAKPAEPAKTEAAEPVKVTPVKDDAREAPYTDARLVSAPPIRKPAAKPADKPAPAAKAETKTETKAESKAEADDKPVPAKVVKDEKPKTRSKTPAAFDATDEERATNRSKLFEGIKSIFSGPVDYITKGSPKMRAKEALKSGMASKDRDAMRKGGSVKKMASGGKVSSASSRGDGCAIRGKTRGKMY